MHSYNRITGGKRIRIGIRKGAEQVALLQESVSTDNILLLPSRNNSYVRVCRCFVERKTERGVGLIMIERNAIPCCFNQLTEGEPLPNEAFDIIGQLNSSYSNTCLK